MLVLSREKHEEIVVGKAGDVLDAPIVIAVVEIRGDKVRLGVEAQRNISVHRAEVQRAIDAAAVSVAPAQKMKSFRFDYEVPPLRGVYQAESDGESEAELRTYLAVAQPAWKILQIVEIPFLDARPASDVEDSGHAEAHGGGERAAGTQPANGQDVRKTNVGGAANPEADCVRRP